MNKSITDDAALDFLQRIVAIPSLSGEERAVAEACVAQMAAWGYGHTEIDAAGNALGMRERPLADGSCTTEIVLLGHIDTVPGDIPVRVEDGKLYGRGSVDAKGPFATFVVAGAQAELPPGTRLIVVGATEEEAATSKGARAVRERFTPDYCVIGEPSGWDGVTLGYKGRILLDYRLEQPMGHTAGPERAVAETAVDFWNRLNAYCTTFNAERERLFDQILPSIRTFNTSSDGLHNVAELKLGFRLPPAYDVTELITRATAAAGAAEISFYAHEKAIQAKRTNRLARALSRAILEAGGKPRPKLKTGTSDMNVVGPRWQCPLVAYGPGDSQLDHTPQEHVVVAEYLQAVEVLTAVLSRPLG